MTTAMYAVEGMMCDSCMAAVEAKINSISGVTVVAMDLVAGGRSPLIVTSGTRLGAEAVRDAVEHVGFCVPHPKGQRWAIAGTAMPPRRAIPSRVVNQ